MFEIFVHELAERELAELRPFERNRIIQQIEAKLRHEATKPTRHRKELRALIACFEAVPPIWELRVGDYRVFYDVDAIERVVFILAIGVKQRNRLIIGGEDYQP